MSASLDHAHLFASDIGRTVDFFTTLLGATVVWDEAAAGVRNVRLALGRGFIHLYDQPPRGERGGVMHHLGVETTDLAALVARMEARGFVFRNAVRSEPRFDYVMIAGPDGLLVELFECHEPARWRIAR